MIFLKKTWEFLFKNFMWLYIIMGVCSWVGIYPMTFQLLMFVSFLYSVVLIPQSKVSNIVDVSILIFIIYVLINALIADYPNKLACLKTDLFFSVFPLSFYFIAKIPGYNFNYYLSKMVTPMALVMVIGIILFVITPSWYVAAKYAILSTGYGYTEANAPEHIIREVFELSSIWKTSYVIGYANAFFIIFLINQLFLGGFKGKQKKRLLLLLFLSVIVMILSGFRAIMLSFVLSISIYFILTNNKKIRKRIIVGSGLLFVIVILGMTYISSDYYEYVIQSFTAVGSQEGLASRFELTAKGVELDSFFGDGFGHYGMGAKEFKDGLFIEDSEYQKILAELGIVGFFFFIVILLSAGFSALRAKCTLELCILLTFSISFIGSSSISCESTFPFIFWYALGCISKEVSYKHASSQVLTSKVIN